VVILSDLASLGKYRDGAVTLAALGRHGCRKGPMRPNPRKLCNCIRATTTPISYEGSLSLHWKESLSRQTMGFEVKQMAGQKPVAKFVAGQISAAIWENEITARNGHAA
jgi:hypothetical protein